MKVIIVVEKVTLALKVEAPVMGVEQLDGVVYNQGDVPVCEQGDMELPPVHEQGDVQQEGEQLCRVQKDEEQGGKDVELLP